MHQLYSVLYTRMVLQDVIYGWTVLTSKLLAMALQYEVLVTGYGSAPRGAAQDVPEHLPQTLSTCCRRLDHAAVPRSVSTLRPADTCAGTRCSSPGRPLREGPVRSTAVPRGYRCC